ncbi:MAG: hypothetical protein ACXWVP_00705 [Burkholderiales bacterium]
MVQIIMNIFRLVFALAILALAGCATVTTHIVELNPARKYPPTTQVEVLLQKPDRPYIEIALIESSGASEAEMLNDAREKARQLGADAIVRTETLSEFHPPVAVYDPWYDPLYSRWPPYRMMPLYPHPWGSYRVLGGYYTYVLKAVAIKYTNAFTPAPQPSS